MSTAPGILESAALSPAQTERAREALGLLDQAVHLVGDGGVTFEPEDREAWLRKRLDYWVKVFNLGHWTIDFEVVDECSENPEIAAQALRSDSYDTATIQFSREWLHQQTPAENDITLAHELMHVQMRNLDEAVGWVVHRLSSAEAEAAVPRILHETEGLVDRLARIIVQAHAGTGILDGHESD